MRRQGTFAGFRVTAEGPLPLAGAASRLTAWRTSARFWGGGVQRDTHQHLVEVGDHFVKFRSTFDAGRGREGEVVRFVEALLGAVL